MRYYSRKFGTKSELRWGSGVPELDHGFRRYLVKGRINLYVFKDLRVIWQPPLLLKFLWIEYTLPGWVAPSRSPNIELQLLYKRHYTELKFSLCLWVWVSCIISRDYLLYFLLKDRQQQKTCMVHQACQLATFPK